MHPGLGLLCQVVLGASAYLGWLWLFHLKEVRAAVAFLSEKRAPAAAEPAAA
jgi:hypothetical protein